MAPVNPRHIVGTQPRVPTSADLHKKLARLEDEYSGHGYRQRSATPEELLVVTGPAASITVVAQHAINHFDPCGREKLADRGTGGLVELLALRRDVLGIVSTGPLHSPADQTRRTALIADLAINGDHPVIDLHGMSCDGDSAIDIGLGREPTDASRSVADAAVMSGERLGLRVTRSRRFAALGEERLTNTLLAEGVPAIQVELCACLRQPYAGPAETTLVSAWFDGLAATVGHGQL